MLIVDTSGLFSLFDSRDPMHAPVQAAIAADHGPFVVSPFVLAELDYLITTRRGVGAELAALAELSTGAWEIAAFGAADLQGARGVIERYQDLDIGLTDASLVVLAARYATNRLLTLDERHFRTVRTLSGKAFELLPGSAD